MKTKFIWTAMCLPLAFAACTNEELITIEDGLANKETVKLELSAAYGADGAESRMVNNNGTFLWDNTDVLGAAMPGASDAVLTNNRFVNTLTSPSAAADFTTQATTTAGTYAFYYPYNTKVTTAPGNGLIYSLPSVQEYDPNGQKMMDNNFMVAPKIVVDGKEPGTLTLPITMRSIYSYGLLNLRLADNLTADYSNVSDVKIQKIIIEYTSNVETDGRIDLDNLPEANITTTRLEAIQAGTYKADGTNVTYPNLKGKELAEIRAYLLDEADDKLVVNKAAYTSGTVLDLTTVRPSKSTNKINKVVISCVTDEYPTGVSLSKGEEFSTRVLLPTTNNAGTNTKVTVYTDKGKKVITSVFNGGKMKANHTVNLANVNRDGDATAIYISGALSNDKTVEAINEADFIASMKQFAGMNNPEIKANVYGFDLTPAAVAAIPSTAKVEFLSAVSFAGDMTLKNMTFAGGNSTATSKVTFKSGNIVLESVAEQQAYTEYVVSKDAKVTVKAFAATSTARPAFTVNGGQITFEKYNSASVEQTQAIYSITLNKVTNNPVAYINTPIEVETGIAASGAILNKSILLTAGTVYNNSLINEINITGGKLVNNKTVANVLNNAGTIDNNATLTLVTANTGTINQLTSSSVIKAGNNAGVINTVAYSQTTVSQTTGEVIYVKNARVAATGGNVTYEAPADFKAVDFYNFVSTITKVRFSGDFTYDYVKTTSTDESTYAAIPVNVTELEFPGNLTLKKDLALNAGTTLYFKGENANIEGSNKITSNGAITLMAGVKKDDTKGIAKVATQVYIAPKVSIEAGAAFTWSPVSQSDATVWNDGTVKGASLGGLPAATWSGNSATTTGGTTTGGTTTGGTTTGGTTGA